MDMDGCRMRKAVRHVLRLRGAVGQRSPRGVEYTPCETVRSTLPCGVVCHRLPRTVARSCRAGLSKRLPRGGSFSTCCAGSCVSARPGLPAVRLYRPGPPVQGPLNAPDWLAGQHADRAWPTRRRGIRMPWWCWPAGRSPCCSPRQWPPGNESPCLIPRQR